MTNAARYSLFALADRKGKTISELLEAIHDSRELTDWAAFYQRQHEIEQEEIERINTGVQLES